MKRGLLDWFKKPADDTIPAPAPLRAEDTTRARVTGRAPETELLSRFTDQGPVGKGGMSSVRRMFDTNLLREVAMKVLDPDLAHHAASRQGFLEEAQITGQLDHPNIVPVHDLGVDDQGTQYLLMKLVAGHTLTRWLKAAPFPLGSAESLNEHLFMFLKVCDAIAFAHSKGVLHCDIKPDNVMVGRFGEVYVMDWGLARLLSPEAGRASIVAVSRPPGAGAKREGVEGTPAFMAPEQALGQVDAIDERTDVFCLGGVLYYMLTGRPPFDAVSARAALERVRSFDLVPPEQIVTDRPLPPGICRIVRHAMARLPEDRYASVTDLRRDVQRFLQGGSHFPQRTFAPGSKIVIEGEDGDRAYIIEKGNCLVYKTVDKQQRILRRLGPGSVFGETAIIVGKPRTATVEAIDEVSVIEIDRHLLEEGLGLDSWIGPFVRALAERFRDVDSRLTQLQSMISGD